MSKRGVTVLLLLALVIALGALVQDARFNLLIARERSAAGTLSFDVRDLMDVISMMRSTQHEYIAAGQGSSGSYARVTAMMDELETRIGTRHAAAIDPDAVAAYATAAEALARFRKIDGQIRTSIEQRDPLHASDLIFMDSTASVQKLNDALKTALTKELAAIDAGISKLGWMRSGLSGAGMLFVVGVALYFGWAVTRQAGKGAPTTAQMFRDLPPAVKSGVGSALPTSAGSSVQLPPVMRPANLTAAAELCVDLGRVMDSGEVPVLLDRAASVLDARGIVLWAIDSDGARLHPSICHGYSEKIVRKLRPLQIDADNVTSLAFRSNQCQTINGASSTDAAAIAVPLMTGTGCVGVLAAELRHNRPPADLMPVARILGAQFSTLITPPEQARRRTAQG